MAILDRRDTAETFPLFRDLRAQAGHPADEHDLRGCCYHVFLRDSIAFVILYDIVKTQEFQILVHESAFDDGEHRVAADLEESPGSKDFAPGRMTGRDTAGRKGFVLRRRGLAGIRQESFRNQADFRPFTGYQGFGLGLHSSQTAYFQCLLAYFIERVRCAEIPYLYAQALQPLLHLILGEGHAKHKVRLQGKYLLQVHFQHVADDFACVPVQRLRAKGRASHNAGVRPDLLQIISYRRRKRNNPDGRGR